MSGDLTKGKAGQATRETSGAWDRRSPLTNMGLGVRATQGTATCPGLEGWRVRGSSVRGWQMIGPRERNPRVCKTCLVRVPVGKPPGNGPTVARQMRQRPPLASAPFCTSTDFCSCPSPASSPWRSSPRPNHQQPLHHSVGVHRRDQAPCSQ